MKQKYFKNDDLLILDKYEKTLNRSFNQNWKEFTKKETDKLLFDLYEKTTGEKLKGYGCPSCVLKSYKKIAELYYLSKRYYEQKAAKAVLKKSVKNNE